MGFYHGHLSILTLIHEYYSFLLWFLQASNY